MADIPAGCAVLETPLPLEAKAEGANVMHPSMMIAINVLTQILVKSEVKNFTNRCPFFARVLGEQRY